MMRQLVNDDEKWRGILRGLQSTFYHQTVTGDQVRAYMNQHAGIDLTKVFEQYQTTTKIPVLEYKIESGKLSYRWANVVPGFDMPVKAAVGSGKVEWLKPTESWKTYSGTVAVGDTVKADPDFYVTAKDVSAGATK